MSNLGHFGIFCFSIVLHVLLICVSLNTLLLACGDVELNPGPPNILHLEHVNIRSIRSNALVVQATDTPDHYMPKFDLLSHHMHHYSYDIMGVSETWLDETVQLNLQVEGYQPPFRRDFNRNQRGVMVYVKCNVAAKRREDLEPRNSELICVEVQAGTQRVLVCNCYRVQYQPIEEFCDDVQAMVDAASAQFQSICIMGDMNARHRSFWTDDACTTEGRALLSLINRLGMKQVIHEPTRSAGIFKSCIDLILTDSPSALVTSGTRDKLTERCDHHPIYAHIRIKQLKQRSYKRMVWQYNQGDYEAFNQLLLHAPWRSCYVEGNADATTERWIAMFMRCAEQCIPHYETTIRPRDKPFMTSDIRRLMHRRDHLHKCAKNSDDPATTQELKYYRNRVVAEIRREKRRLEEETDRSLSKDVGTKKWWKAYKRVTGATSSQIGPLADAHGKLFSSSQEKADLLNQHFVSQTKIQGDAAASPPLTATPDNRIDPLVILPEMVYDILR